MAKKGLTKKKKGPSGKRAREAIKRRNQWGEDVDESAPKEVRKGKRRLVDGPSRIINPSFSTAPISAGQDRKKWKQEEDWKQVDENSPADDGSSVESADDDYDDSPTADGSLNTLLKNIGASNEDQIEDSESDESKDEILSDDDVAATDSEINVYSNIPTKPQGTNPFRAHFYPPTDEIDEHLSQMKKIPFHANKNLALQLSENLNSRWCTSTNAEINFPSITLDSFSHVRQELSKNWKDVNTKFKNKEVFSPMQSVLFPPLSNYADALIPCMTRQNRHSIDNILALHILNHILSSNKEISSNNKKLKAQEPNEHVEYRDQGFTRPKVLVILPTRSIAYSFIKLMLEILGDITFLTNEERFENEYGDAIIEDSADDEKEMKRRKNVLKAKGHEWGELFGDGVNSDDDFKMGISFSYNMKQTDKGKKPTKQQKLSVKLFADFYHSDIIVASPLGLKTAMPDDENDDGDGDSDYLSSIEVCLVHHSDVILMQNWDHVNSVVESINQQPQKNNNTDFSRVRNYFLSDLAASRRQTILVSRFIDPHIMATFNKYANSCAGRLKLIQRIPNDKAKICDVMVQVRQVFQRIHCESLSSQGDARLKHFKEVIVPQLHQQDKMHVLIYIPSYFDFVAVRNLLLNEEASFVSITEYARVSEVSRGRARFLQGRKRIMLYTGRALFFLRHHIKGAKHLIMFGLPEHAEFYPSLLNMISEWSSNREMDSDDESFGIGPQLSCLSLFTKYDGYALERIVGSKHSAHMLKSEKKTYFFNT